jgi:hypothetical protein
MLYPAMLNRSLFRENGLRRAPSAICSTKISVGDFICVGGRSALRDASSSAAQAAGYAGE